MSGDWRESVASCITVVVALLGGGAVQLLLWKKPGDSYLDTLDRHPYLWFFYLLFAMLVTEHILKWINKWIRWQRSRS